MHDDAVQTTTGAFEPGPGEPTGPWTRPSFEVLSRNFHHWQKTGMREPADALIERLRAHYRRAIFRSA